TGSTYPLEGGRVCALVTCAHIRFGSKADKPPRVKTRLCPLCADIVVEVGSFGCDVPASVFFETSSYYAPLGSGITYQLY
ncbi:MAG: hypothetical protein WA669_10735, partial [Pseudolabrys sp.]